MSSTWAWNRHNTLSIYLDGRLQKYCPDYRGCAVSSIDLSRGHHIVEFRPALPPARPNNGDPRVLSYVFHRIQFKPAGADGIPSHDLFHTFEDEPSFEPVAAGQCAGAIDVVNGMSPAPENLSASTFLQLTGWVAESVQEGRVPDAVYVVQTDADGRHKYAKAQSMPRPDVAAHFQKPTLTQAGFTLTADLAMLKGRYTFGIGMKKDGRILTCRNLQLPATFAIP